MIESVDLRGQRAPLVVVAGSPISVTVTQADDLSAAVVTAPILEMDLSDTGSDWATAVSGVDNDVLTLSLSGSATTSLGVGRYRCPLTVDSRPWAVFYLTVEPVGSPRRGSSVDPSFTLTVTEGPTLAVTVVGGVAPAAASVVSVGDAGGYFIGSTVEAVTQEVGASLAAIPSQYVPADGNTLASTVTQGLYDRVLVGGRALVVDPAVSGRVWFVRTSDGKVVFSDDNGDTFTLGSDNPDSGDSYAIVGMYFNTSFAFLLTSGTGSRQGRLHRSPLPAADGTGLVWTKIHDLLGGALGPGSASTNGGENSQYRCSSFAVMGQQAVIGEYSGTAVTGGPSVYFCANINVAIATNITWSNRKTFANAKHIHACQFSSAGYAWASLGDAGATATDIGMWSATINSNQSAWTQRSLCGEAIGGTTLYPINFREFTIAGQKLWIGESDTKRGMGPVVMNSILHTASLPIMPMFDIPAPYKGTMRQLTVTAEDNLMWVTTGENAAIGPLDSIWISKYPYRTAVLLDSLASANTFGTLGDGVVSGDKVFFGKYRCVAEKFAGQ